MIDKPEYIDEFLERRLPSWLKMIADEKTYSVMSTTRGVTDEGSSAYDDFNICHYTGDAPSHVKKCLFKLADFFDTVVDKIVVPRQVHFTKICVIDSLPFDRNSIEGVDGIVTSHDDIIIGVSTADCVPVILRDDSVGISGALHAGWRGAINGIVARGIEKMKTLGADPSNIKAYVGPAICVDCFEVGDEVASLFPESCVKRFGSERRPHVDLPGFVASELVRSGVLIENVQAFNKELCTRCHSRQFFSARASGVESGRNYTFLIVKRV